MSVPPPIETDGPELIGDILARLMPRMLAGEPIDLGHYHDDGWDPDDDDDPPVSGVRARVPEAG